MTSAAENGSDVVRARANTFHECELLEKTLITPNSSIYRFKLPLDSNLDVPTGQHVRLAGDVVLSDGSSQRCVRSYTPIAIDHDAHYFELLIKSYPLGKLSNYISSLEVGQNIHVCGPQGHFIYRPNMASRIGMIAGGTGITPMLPILRTVICGRVEGRDSTTIDLIFANSTIQDILFKDELDEMARTDPNFRVHYILSTAPDDWTGGTGHVSSDMITRWLPAPGEGVRILMCGPPPMVSMLKKTMASLGYGKARVVSKPEDQVFVF